MPAPARVACSAAVDDRTSGRIEDGGGMCSTADWSSPRESVDHLQGLREMWLGFISRWDLIGRLERGWEKGSQGLLSEEEVCELRESTVAWLLAEHGVHSDLGVSQDQPMALDVLRGLLRASGDLDTALPGVLLFLIFLAVVRLQCVCVCVWQDSWKKGYARALYQLLLPLAFLAKRHGRSASVMT